MMSSTVPPDAVRANASATDRDPDPGPRRIAGYDIARALAVFGMVLVNFTIAMGAMGAERAEGQGPSWLTGFVRLFEGRAAATFVVLAGVGVSLMSAAGRLESDRARLARARRTLLHRAALLFVVGLAYTPVWPADILHFYGVYLALAAFLLAAPSARLWALAAALPLGFCALLFVFDYEAGWDWTTLSYAGFWTPAGMLRHLLYNGFHPVVPWLAFLLLGMLLGRQDLRSPAVRRRVFALGLAVALAAELTSALFVRVLVPALELGARDAEDLAALFGAAPMPPTPLYMLAGAGTACAVIAASVTVGERWGSATWLRPLVATGQLALTLYVAHVLVGLGTLEALGRLEEQSLEFAVTAAAIFCTAAVVFAWAWRARFRRGPLEALLRAVTGR